MSILFLIIKSLTSNLIHRTDIVYGITVYIQIRSNKVKSQHTFDGVTTY